MTQAWVKRSSERQALLNNLMQQACDKGDELGGADAKMFEFELMQVLLEYLKRRRVKVDQKEMESTAGAFFCNHLLARITIFSRAQEETEWLVGELLGKLLHSVQSRLAGELTKLEQLSPDQIFQAPSAMGEVPLEG